MQIGNINLPGNIFLAPMAGVTDLPFRLLCREKGASLVYTEMVSAKAMHYNDEETIELSRTHPDERPVAVQIFGSDPEVMAEAAQRFSARDDISIIDINMGCPAPKIAKNGEGCALMRNPGLVRQIVRATVAAAEKPVTVKIRKGWDASSLNAMEIAGICEEEGAAAITIHGRTRDQYYAGNADWSIIKDIKKQMSIPVIGNGDVKTPEDAKRMLDETGCDAVMVGRGAQGNPWLFSAIASYLSSGSYQREVPAREKLEIILRQYSLMEQYKGKHKALLEMRKHTAWYLHGLSGSAKIKSEIFQTQDLADAKKILTEYMLQAGKDR